MKHLMPPCPAPAPGGGHGHEHQGYSLLGVVVRHVLCVCVFLLLVMLPSEIPRLPTDLPVRGFPTVWKRLLLHDWLLRMGLHPKLFCLFCVLYFVLPPFEENGLPFWVPGVLCQHSEVVLWKLLSIQIIFWWICGGESGLPVLFLCHLGTTPPKKKVFWLKNKQIMENRDYELWEG